MTNERIALQLLYEAAIGLELAIDIALQDGKTSMELDDVKAKALLEAIGVARIVGVMYGEMTAADLRAAQVMLVEAK
jgi:hypothetical protein